MSPADASSGRGPDGRTRPRFPDTSPVVTRTGTPEQPGGRRPADPGRGPAGPRTRVVVTARRRPPGRSRRLLQRWGWRAYAIPLLALATVATLVDLVVSGTGTRGPATASPPSVAAAAPTPELQPEVEPVAEPPAPPGVRAEVDAAPSGAPEAAAGAPGFVQQGAGTVTVVDGTSPVYGTGPLQRFVVEVEDGIEVDGTAFAAAVEETLGDPRSWGNGGRASFQRVGRAQAEAGDYAFRVTLISPGSMERYCPGVGTGGYTSCRYGERAVINLARWATAVPDYQGDIPTYRQYVVNHEVGHALGNGHQVCPGPGQPAPVMQQQTLGLEGCTKNAWPHP
ncbi:DUF3152 domain-containing protein [Geodermatophilus sp. DSM 44513]|uniref:DUF3152 domain-containing protein n=1 Tax=Geodermatophilus sp. DSM 44513 TaxID=1528104 RepID=UPI0012757F4B|nr:DUF3152 domain-containing protein [Geodermatophilus sp. DSM 44513]WNV74709.1 DUF3152 domain-containing protein [Geodermatophilus sp. DSM 44513]